MCFVLWNQRLEFQQGEQVCNVWNLDLHFFYSWEKAILQFQLIKLHAFRVLCVSKAFRALCLGLDCTVCSSKNNLSRYLLFSVKCRWSVTKFKNIVANFVLFVLSLWIVGGGPSPWQSSRQWPNPLQSPLLRAPTHRPPRPPGTAPNCSLFVT